MNSMFAGCSSLESIDLLNFDTSNVFYMDYMFYGCSSLSSLYLSNFDTSLVTNMNSMFYGCISLISLDLSNFITTSLSDMSRMFYQCDSLKYLDISNFNMINCNSYSNLFSSIDNIRYIDLYNFQNDKILSRIFSEINNDLFACQRDNIITSAKAYNCCDYNFIDDICNSNLYGYSSIISQTDSSSSEETNITIPSNNTQTFSSKNSSSSSIGIIIGIIGGVVAIIAAVTIIICCCKKKKEIPLDPPNDSTTNSIISSPITSTKPELIYEYEPEKQSANKKTIIFETTGQYKVQISIEPEKTMEELIKYYFEVRKKKELFGDKTISFMMNGNIIFQDSKNLIKTYLNKKNDVNIILVNDVEEKLN